MSPLVNLTHLFDFLLFAGTTQKISFSTPYLDSGLRILVNKAADYVDSQSSNYWQVCIQGSFSPLQSLSRGACLSLST